jgi:hypothetical protein
MTLIQSMACVLCERKSFAMTRQGVAQSKAEVPKKRGAIVKVQARKKRIDALDKINVVIKYREVQTQKKTSTSDNRILLAPPLSSTTGL